MEHDYTIKDSEIIDEKEITIQCVLEDSEKHKLLKYYAGEWPQQLMDNEDDVCIGYTEDTNAIKLSYSDLLKHLCLVGETGFGKSAVFQNVMYQWAKNKYGFCYIDRKGQDVKEFLQRIPEDRINDIVWVEPYSIDEISEINIKQAVKNDKIILVKLSQIHTTETQKEIGLELLENVWTAVNERTKPFSLMIDEVDVFDLDILEKLFSEGRSKKLSLTVSTQNFNALRVKTQDVIQYNCSNVFSFRITSNNKQTQTIHKLLNISFSELADLDAYNCISRDTTKITTFAPYPPVRSKKDCKNLI